MKKITKLISQYLIKEEWTIAIRPKTEKLLFEEGGLEAPFSIVPNSFRYWCADPFIITNNEKDYLFFEMFDRFKSKGLIGCREIKDGKIGKMKVVYEEPTHLSFPFIFKEHDIFYMMPESSEGGTLKILKSEGFPKKWVLHKTLFSEKRVVDSSLLEKGNGVFLFTQELRNGYSFTQLDLYKIVDDKLVAFKKNPIVDSSSNSRLAGKLFGFGEKIFRVAQDCSEDYGKKINFNTVNMISEELYEEKFVKSISFEDITINSKKTFCGVHTYNFDENYEVIDVKNLNSVKTGNLINLFYRIVLKLFLKK